MAKDILDDLFGKLTDSRDFIEFTRVLYRNPLINNPEFHNAIMSSGDEKVLAEYKKIKQLANESRIPRHLESRFETFLYDVFDHLEKYALEKYKDCLNEASISDDSMKEIKSVVAICITMDTPD